jgi:serine phosphatase RsbU (regulator of sigma subunit)
MNRIVAKPRKAPGSPPTSHARHTWYILKSIVRNFLLVLLWIIRILVLFFILGAFAAHNYIVFLILLVAVSIIFALLRSRLVNFNKFINRSLVYSLLTVSLTALYFGMIAALQFANSTSEFWIVVSTLSLVALFAPMRTQIQKFIDLRFYRRKYDASQVIATFTSTLREEIDLEQLNVHLLAVVEKTFLPEIAALWLQEPTSNNDILRFVQWQPAAQQEHPANSQARTEEMIEVPCDDALAVSMVETGNVLEIDRLFWASPLEQAVRATGTVITLPLVNRGALIGLLNLGPRKSGQRYSPDDRELLNTLAVQVAPALHVAQMVLEEQTQIRERERIEQELRTARSIQLSLLPTAPPELAGWHVTAHYQPAHEVGGDFYDFLRLNNDRLGIVIGDVSDKGVPAALVMARTSSMLRAAAQVTDAPGAVLAQVNDLLHADTLPMMFVTCFYAILDLNSGRLCYANAGQDLPYHWHSGGVGELFARGMPLGMMPGMYYEEQETLLGDGERILFYSDGLVEAHNSTREMFGFPRLKSFMEEHAATLPGTALIDALLHQLKDFTGEGWEQEDDVTLVILQRVSPESLFIQS